MQTTVNRKLMAVTPSTDDIVIGPSSDEVGRVGCVVREP
jgi:hypothetical protein